MTVHVPKISQQERISQQSVEQIIEVPAPLIQQEMVRLPKITQAPRNHHIEVEQVIEVPVPVHQEEIVHVPKVMQQARTQHVHVEQFIDVPVPMQQEDFDVRVSLVLGRVSCDAFRDCSTCLYSLMRKTHTFIMWSADFARS